MTKRLLAIILSLGLVGSLFAAPTIYWNGTTDNQWGIGSNWTGGTQPGALVNPTVVLRGNTNTHTVLNSSTNIKGLVFDRNAAAFWISKGEVSSRGGSLPLLTIGSDGIKQYNNQTNKIFTDIALSSNQTWDIRRGTLMDMGGIQANGKKLFKRGDGTLVFGGKDSNTNMGNFEIYNGTVSLQKVLGAQAITGSIEIEDGRLVLNGNEQIADTSSLDIEHNAGVFDLQNQYETIGSLKGTGRVLVTDITSSLTIAGSESTTYSGKIQGAGAFRKTGTSTLTLSGINSYTGQTFISGGTLRLGRNQALSNLSNLTMAGGRFATNGYNQTMGTFTLNADSTIDLSGGHSKLTFANSSGASWQPNKTLSITGWNGSIYGGGAEQLTFGASGLNASQLSMIKFFNPAGLNPGIYDARMLANGEIVPVPEPATIGLGALLLGLMGKRMRRKKKEIAA